MSRRSFKVNIRQKRMMSIGKLSLLIHKAENSRGCLLDYPPEPRSAVPVIAWRID